MELKVWVEGIQRVVCGVTEATTCQVRETGRDLGQHTQLSVFSIIINKSITIHCSNSEELKNHASSSAPLRLIIIQLLYSQSTSSRRCHCRQQKLFTTWQRVMADDEMKWMDGWMWESFHLISPCIFLTHHPSPIVIVLIGGERSKNARRNVNLLVYILINSSPLFSSRTWCSRWPMPPIKQGVSH